MNQTTFKLLLLSSVATALTLMSGCGDSGPKRIPLTGVVFSKDVTGDLNGTIALLPSKGTKGPAANGLVKSGVFTFTEENGPVVGQHRVLVDVEPPRDKMDKAAEDAALQGKFEFESTVPAEPPFVLNFELVREKSDEQTE